MQQGNVEVVRAIYEHFAATGTFPWDRMAPDATFDASDVMPDLGVMHGSGPGSAADTALRWYASLFDGFEITLERIVATAGDHVVTTVRDGGRMKGSQARVMNEFHHAWTFREGKAVRWSSHTKVERALEAVALGT